MRSARAGRAVSTPGAGALPRPAAPSRRRSRTTAPASRPRLPGRPDVALNVVVGQTLGLRQNQLALSGIEVVRELTPELPPIAGDIHQIEQVFLNLLLNAEQAILEGEQGGHITVRTRVAEAGRAVEAEGEDDRPGIAPPALPPVFEPFFTTKTVGSGTGLGLSVSYGIVQEHGGRLRGERRAARAGGAAARRGGAPGRPPGRGGRAGRPPRAPPPRRPPPGGATRSAARRAVPA